VSDVPKIEITQFLGRLAGGDAAAAEGLYPAVYQELRGIAARWFRRSDRELTLQPTALVHEAYMHLVDQTHADWRNRSHFFAVAAMAMRQILIQHARKRGALKRGSDWGRITLSQAALVEDRKTVDLLDLDAALTELQQLHERQARVVELRFFGELSVDETAMVLGVSPRTVKLDWRMARAWLRSKLTENGGR
jgi:RNA polymerase sigma factor (TIGR02999 family)